MSPLTSSFIFIPLCGVLVVLVLVFSLGCLALLIWLPFLPYAYYMPFVYFAFVSWFSFLNPFLVTMSFACYFHSRFLLSAFFSVCLFVLFCFSPTVFVPGLFWYNLLYLVTAARFVAEQLKMRDKQQRVRFCVILVFCFHLSSSCDVGESGMDSAPLSFLGS